LVRILFTIANVLLDTNVKSLFFSSHCAKAICIVRRSILQSSSFCQNDKLAEFVVPDLDEGIHHVVGIGIKADIGVCCLGTTLAKSDKVKKEQRSCMASKCTHFQYIFGVNGSITRCVFRGVFAARQTVGRRGMQHWCTTMGLFQIKKSDINVGRVVVSYIKYAIKNSLCNRPLNA
jgi:hypothetical protein